MRTGGTILATGLIIGGAAPTVALVAIFTHGYLLGCHTPRPGPCRAHGIDVDAIGLLGKSALEFSFLAVPLGLALCALGLVWIVIDWLTPRRTQEDAQDATSLPPVAAPAMQQDAKEPAAGRRSQPLFLARLLFEWTVGAAAIGVFAMAGALPSRPGRMVAAGSAMYWQAAAALGILLTLGFLLRRRRYAPLLLLASGLFFFSSCTANFHWQGG